MEFGAEEARPQNQKLRKNRDTLTQFTPGFIDIQVKEHLGDGESYLRKGRMIRWG